MQYLQYCDSTDLTLLNEGHEFASVPTEILAVNFHIPFLHNKQIQLQTFFSQVRSLNYNVPTIRSTSYCSIISNFTSEHG